MASVLALRLPRRLLLLVASTVAALVMAEMAVRFFPDFQPRPRLSVGELQDRPQPHFVSDPVTGWRMRPSHQFLLNTHDYRTTYSSNAQGFRRNSDFGPAERRRKIALIGDSFAFGLGVQYEETYGALIESALPGTVVYNLAMPAFGLDQIWFSVRHHALPLRPDLVIVAFISDDFTRSQSAHTMLNKPSFKLVDGRLVSRTAEDRPNALVRFLEHHSHLWMAGRLGSIWLAYRVPFGEWWFLNEAILDALRADCRGSGTPVLFLYHPSKAWRPVPTLRGYMARVGANFIDLTDQQPSAPGGIFFPRDMHLTPQGHRFVADAVLRWIRTNMPELSDGLPVREPSKGSRSG